MKNTTNLISTAMLVLGISLPLVTAAQAGALDLSFDTDGIVSTAIGDYDDYAYAIAIQPDGKIVAAGYSDNGDRDVFALTRYNTNGSLDNTFDTDGIVTTAIGTSGNRVRAIALQDDGKIVVAGYSFSTTSGNDFALARYNTNGSLDNSFDSDGIVTTAIGGYLDDRAFSVAIQNDGKILAAGYHTDEISLQRDFALIRYNSNGSLDNTFNSGGIVTLSFAPGNDEGRSIVVQSDDKIIVAGHSFDFATRLFALVRYNTDGSLDNSFDSDGRVTTSIGSGSTDDAGYSAVLQDDDKTVLVGYTHGATYDYAIVRYNTNGSLDTDFGGDGIVITSVETSGSSSDEAHAVTIQTDGKIVVAGNTDYDFSMARYDANGNLDNTFDTDGTLFTDISSPAFYDKIEGISVQSDGKIVAVGYSGNGTDYDFTVARYNNEPGTGIPSSLQQNNDVLVFPNPFSGSATVQTDYPWNDVHIIIVNVYGQTVKRLDKFAGQAITINRDNLPGGLYSLLLIRNTEVLSRTKLVITD